MNNNRKTVLASTLVIELGNREIFLAVGENVHLKSLATTPWLNIRQRRFMIHGKGLFIMQTRHSRSTEQVIYLSIYFITYHARLHLLSVCVILTASMDLFPSTITATWSRLCDTLTIRSSWCCVGAWHFSPASKAPLCPILWRFPPETYHIRLQASATRLQKPHLTTVKYFWVWLYLDWLTGGVLPSGSSAEALVSLKGVYIAATLQSVFIPLKCHPWMPTMNFNSHIDVLNTCMTWLLAHFIQKERRNWNILALQSTQSCRFFSVRWT